MALAPVITETKGTSGRYLRRAEAKIAARKHRRRNDKQAIRDQLGRALKSQRPAEP